MKYLIIALLFISCSEDCSDILAQKTQAYIDWQMLVYEMDDRIEAGDSVAWHNETAAANEKYVKLYDKYQHCE